MSMNIYAKKGTKVRVAHPSWGYEHDQKKVADMDGIYTVERTEVHSSSTDVYLEEFPGKRFNSVNFEEVVA